MWRLRPECAAASDTPSHSRQLRGRHCCHFWCDLLIFMVFAALKKKVLQDIDTANVLVLV